jgi:hypothetical protein
MSDLFVFSFGSIIFIFSTWATLSFGLAKMHELAEKDMNESPRIAEIQKGQFTDVYVTQPLDESAASPPEVPQ